MFTLLLSYVWIKHSLSGGVLLTFTGDSLNVTQEPTLEISIGNVTLAAVSKGYSPNIFLIKLVLVLLTMQVCSSMASSTLHCIAPEVPNYVVENAVGQPLNYTLIMDNAPGPLLNNRELQLELRPNPVFREIQETDRVYLGPSDDITIIVS